MRKPKTLDLDDGWAECVLSDEHPQCQTCVNLAMLPWLSAAQCRRLAAWLLKAADWIEAKEEGR